MCTAPSPGLLHKALALRQNRTPRNFLACGKPKSNDIRPSAMNDSREPIYLVKPLPNPRDIRILDIQPADDFDSLVCCSSRVISLDSREIFQTLSYAWGSPVKHNTIICDGKSLPVTVNLERALRRIREKICPKDIFSSAIWIDAVCINQADDLEKSKQVAMMGEIYQHSCRLIIWLGEASNDEIISIKSALKSPPVPTSINILRGLTRRAWFRRLRVIQEVFKSHRATRYVLLGSFRFKFDALIMSCMTAHLPGTSGTLLHVYMSEYFRSHKSLITSKQNGFPSMVQNLICFRNAEAFLSHDRIYALLSISDPGSTVPVDYQMTLESIHVDLAKRHARQGELVQLLMCAITFRVQQKSLVPRLAHCRKSMSVKSSIDARP